MPKIVKIKRSNVPGETPVLTFGELAWNSADGKLYAGNAANQAVAVNDASSFSFPTASDTVLGAIKVGSGLSISSGVLSATGGGGSGSDSLLRSLFVPPAPTGVAATPGNAQAALSWTAPTVLAQTPITDYTIQYSSDSGSSWTTFSDGASAATSATVTGLTNGTAYTFRVAGVNAVGTGSYSTASSAATPISGDPYFSNVALLLHMDGTGSTFVDSSGTPKSVSALGNSTQSATQSRWGGKSAYFDGSGDYLQIASNAAFGFGTSDFTIEYWHYPLQNSGNETHIDTRPSDAAAWLVLGKSSAGAVRCYDGSSVRTGGSMNLNAWNHIAWVRSSGVNTLYLNGSSVITFTNSSDAGSSCGLTIGSNVLTSAENTYGYIDDLRITKGVARTITVPTAAFLDSGAGATPVVTISSQPSNQTASSGSATFSVTASVTQSASLSYQWQKSTDSGSTWTAISGATSSSLALSSLTTSDNSGQYRVVVGASGGATSVTSNAATLTVNASYTPTAVLLTSGTSYTVPSGATSMKAWAVGGGGYGYGGGAGGTAYKTWAVTGGSSVTYAVAPAGATGGVTRQASTTVTHNGVTITGLSGRTTGGGAGILYYGTGSGGDGGANGGESPSGERGGAVGGNGTVASCGRVPMTDVSGLKAAVSLAGGKTVEDCGTDAAFGSGASGKFDSPKTAGYGGGGGTASKSGGAGAVVLYFT